MRKRGILLGVFTFLVVNFLFVSLFLHQSEKIPLKMQPIYVNPLRLFRLFRVMDIDRDGKNELIVSSPFPAIAGKNEVSIFEPFARQYNFRFLGEFLVKAEYYIIGSREIKDEKGRRDMLFEFVGTEDGKTYIRYINNRGDVIKTIPLEDTSIKFKKAGGTRFQRAVLIDLDGDGKDELVGVLFTTYLRIPRGMAAYDPETGKLLWEYYAGAMINNEYLFRDLDGDGRKEIVIGTFACNNGAVLNGTDDRHSYLIVLNSDGTEKWKRELGYWYTTIYLDVKDLDGDGIQDIVAAKEVHRSTSPEPGEVWVFKGTTGELKARIFRNYTSFSRPSILNFRGKKYIYVGDSQGNIWMFDRNLKVINKTQVGTPVVILNPWEGRDWHFIFAGTISRFIAFTKDLKRRVFEYKYVHPLDFLRTDRSMGIYDFSTGERRMGVMATDGLYELREREITFADKVKAFFLSGLPVTITGFLLFNFILITFLFSLQAKPAEYRQDEISSWAEVIQELAHRMKTPLTTLFWSLEKAKKDVRQGRRITSSDVDSMMEDIEKLNRGLISFMKMASLHRIKKEKLNLSEVLFDLVEKYRNVVQERVEFHVNIEDDLLIEGDQELLTEAFVNLVENSIEAMPEGGKLSIIAYRSSNPFTSREEVVVEIIDTGIGIEKEHLSRIFNPNFSTKKKGMGIGLTIAKRIIEAHGGRIEVSSKVGLGTEFAIYFPVRGNR